MLLISLETIAASVDFPTCLAPWITVTGVSFSVSLTKDSTFLLNNCTCFKHLLVDRENVIVWMSLFSRLNVAVFTVACRCFHEQNKYTRNRERIKSFKSICVSSVILSDIMVHLLVAVINYLLLSSLLRLLPYRPCTLAGGSCQSDRWSRKKLITETRRLLYWGTAR